MKIVDANVLLSAANSAARQHETSRTWRDANFASRSVVGLPWVVLLAFLRLSTKAGIFPRPLAVGAAVEQVEAWLAHPASVVPEPTARHAGVLGGLLCEVGSGGNLVTDVHPAALAVEHGAVIVSWDRDFGRFSGVRSETPG